MVCKPVAYYISKKLKEDEITKAIKGNYTRSQVTFKRY